MGSSQLGIVLLVGAAWGQASNGQADYVAAVTASARELARQIEYLQRSFASIPGPSEGRGLYQQSDQIQYDLIYFRQQLGRKAAREDLYLAFDKMDGKLNQLLGDIQGFEKWVPAVRMTARLVRSAQHDLQFALAAGDGTPARQSQAAYRQTLVLLTRTEDLENTVRFVFDEMDSLPSWNAGFKDLRRAMAQLQRLEQNKAARADLKKQFLQTDQVWEKLVGKFKDLPDGQHLILRVYFGQVDQVFARLARMYGIEDRRAPLRVDFI